MTIKKSLYAFIVLAIMAAFSTACGGDDNPDPCEVEEGCIPPDADDADSDASPTEPDADVSALDAGPATEACSAEIMALNGTVWYCGGTENCVLSAWNDVAGQCRIGMPPAWGGYVSSRVIFDPDMWGLDTTDGTHCDRLQ